MKNQNRWKDMLAGALVVTAVAGLAVPTLAATGSRNVRVDYSDIKLVVNGTTVTPKDSAGNVVEPFTIDGTTYLPVRAVANALGMDVSWNGSTNTVTITDKGTASSTATTTTTTTTTTQTDNYIGEARAKEIALNHAGISSSQAAFAWTKLDWDNGRAEYEVEFYAGGKEYDYDIDAITGEIRSYDYEAEHYTPSANASTTQTGNYIGETKAKEIALNHAGLSSSAVTFVRANLDWDDGRAEYEVEFYAGGKEYDYDIDAVTGDIRSYDYDTEYYAPSANTSTTTGASITETQAKSIVQERAGSTSGTFREFKLDRDDGRSVYEGEYRVGWTEYDFEIDASTGTVLEWSVD